MRVKVWIIACICLFSSGMLKAQDKSEKLEQKTQLLESSRNKFTLSGYIQAQYQYAQTDADGINFKMAQRKNAYETAEQKDFGRFGLRRGRLKLTYEEGIAAGVVQIDVTEKGINTDRNVVTFKDIYLQVKGPWAGNNMLKAGVFYRPFGFEIAYSSSRRESPERSRIIQSLFPDERDLGLSLTLQPPLRMLKFEGGLFAGNGIKPQFTNRMDFIGRLSITKDASFGAGVSAYLGGVLQQHEQTYKMKDKTWVIVSETPHNIGKYAKRRYIGFDAQYSVKTVAGLTQIRGEYIFGEHPGNEAAAYPFNFNGLPPVTAVYIRKINGGYALLTQDLGKTPFTFVAKYDWYNPNTQISGNQITNSGEITVSTIGFGLYWHVNQALRLTAYYDFVRNETTNQLRDDAYSWDKDRKDNVFTLRLQYRF